MENTTNTAAVTNELTLQQVTEKTHKIFKKESGILEIMSYVAVFAAGMSIQHLIHYKFWNKEFKGYKNPTSTNSTNNPTK